MKLLKVFIYADVMILILLSSTSFITNLISSGNNSGLILSPDSEVSFGQLKTGDSLCIYYYIVSRPRPTLWQTS